MDRSNPKNIYKRLLRTADMPEFRDMGGQLSNRGLKWQRFQEGSFANNSLPEDMVAQIAAQRSSFMSEFSQFVTNPETGNAVDAFKGMIFTVYAPNFIGDDLPPEAQLTPEQQATLDFVKRTNMVLPGESENPAKQIGSDWWFSHYAYAWKDELGDEIQDVGASQSNKIQTVTNPELARSKGYDFGPVVVAPTGSGYGVFINTDAGGTENGMLPMLGLTKPQNMDKFFISPGGNARGLRPNASDIILPEGPQGSRVEYARQQRPRNRAGMDPAELEMAERVNQSIRDAREDGTLWQLRLSDDGTLYGKSKSSGDEAPLSRSIVEQLIKPEYFDSMQQLVPERTRDDQVREQGVGNMGRWQLSDGAKAAIMGDPSNPYANPKSVAALQALRSDINEMRGGNRVELNGFHIITIGPKFSNPTNLGHGQTTSSPGFVNPQTMVNPADQSALPVVDRGTKWAVLVDEFQGEKLKSQGRRGNPKKKSAEFDDLHKAFEWAKGQYGGDTKAFDVGERTVRAAMNALQSSSTADFDVNNGQNPPPMGPQINVPEVGPSGGVNNSGLPMNDMDQNVGSRTASSHIRKMMKRFRH
jgi:hypothetical protein